MVSRPAAAGSTSLIAAGGSPRFALRERRVGTAHQVDQETALDNDPKHAVRPTGYRLGPVDDDSPDVEGPAQFSLRSLFLVQAAFAAFLVLLLAAGILAVLGALILTIVLQWGPLRIRNAALRRVVFDLLAGVAMPLLCLRYDPGLFRDYGTVRIVPLLLVGFQICVMPVWLVYDTVTGRPSALFGGMLAIGFVVAMATGAFLIPLSVIGLIIGIGVLGFTPFLTAYAFGRNARRALRPVPGRSRWVHVILVVAGAAVAVGVPLLLAATCGPALADAIKQIPRGFRFFGF